MRILFLMYFIHFFRHGMVLPIIPLFAEKLGAGEAMVGLVVGSFNVLSLVLALVVGDLADRMPIKKMLILGAFCNFLYSGLLCLVQTPWELVGTQTIGGLGFLLLIVCTQAYISGIEDIRKREKCFSRITLAAALGQTSGPLCGGWILSAFSFSVVFISAVGVSTLGSVIFFLREERKRIEYAPPAQSFKQKLGVISSMLRDMRMGLVLIFTLAVILPVTLRGSFLPILLKDKGISEVNIGAMLSVFAVAMTLVRLGVGRVLARFSRLQVMLFVLLLLGISVGSLPLISPTWGLVIALAVFGTAFGLSQPLSMVMVSESSNDEQRGLAMGVRFSTITLGTFTGPQIMGLLAEYGGISLPFYAALLPVLLTAGLLVLLKRHLPLKSA